MTRPKPILVAVPLDWRNDIEAILEKENYVVVMAAAKDEALQLLDSRQWGGFITTADWVIEDIDTMSLIERIKGKMPTLTLITEESVEQFGFGQVIDKTYLSAIHQFCTVPFSSEELIGRLHRAIESFDA
jgi:DNA-binding NtrC family response regulator